MACDFDTQRMLVRQCALRNSRYPDGVELDIVDGDLTVDGIQELEAIHHDDYDLVICDMPGTNTFTMDRALDAMDAIIVPISGGPYELISTSNLIAKATTKGWPTYLIPNNIPPFQNRRARARSSVQQIGTNVAPLQLVRRVAHPDAA